MDVTPSSEDGQPDETREDAGGVEARVLLAEIREQMFGRRERLSIGHFDLLQRLGRGAHGSVYLADDTTLQRRVAVKLLRGEPHPMARARLLREAQALARLKHPHVLTIHEVGVDDDRVFVAMEYVEGGTLARWCESNPPGTRARFGEVLRLAIGTAQGLAAAHDAGIVHRDVKPANILVGVDGRPRIADFGLARAMAEASRDDRERPDDDSMSGEGLTRSGEIIGTPAYMAPEQFEGRGDAASDQWGLCVAFWEAAYGERPFAGREDVATLAAAVRQLLRSPPSERTEVPDWWRRILARGLSVDPSARWPSVAALGLALAQATARRARRRLVLAGVATALVGVCAAGGWQLDRERRRTRCREDAAAIAEVWNETIADRLHDAIVGTDVSYAETTFAHARPRLDEYAEEWRTQYADLCIAAEVDGQRTRASWAASRWCLQERRGELAAMLGVLTEDPDATTVQQTVSAVAGLGRVEACADDARLPGHDADDDDATTSDLLARLWRARALAAAGRYADGLAVAQSLREDAAEHPSVRLRIRVLVFAAGLLWETGDLEQARVWLGDAFDQALAAGEHDLARESAIDLAFLVGDIMARPDEGLWWARVATGLEAYLGGADDLEAASLRSAVANIHHTRGKHADAELEHRRSLAILDALLGSDHPSLATPYNNLGAVYLAQGQYAQAEHAFGKAFAISEQALGPDHPKVADSLSNLGIVYRDQERYEDAEDAHTRALEIREHALGSDHLQVAELHSSIGDDYFRQGRFADAVRAQERARAILERALGPEHPRLGHVYDSLAMAHASQGALDEAEREFLAGHDILEKALGPDHADVARGRLNLGSVYQMRGQHERAERAYASALGVYEKALAPEHPELAAVHNNLGAVYEAQGRYAEAERAYAKALAIAEKALGPESRRVLTALQGLAEVQLRLRRPSAAAVAAERALAIRTKGGDAIEIADARFVLARALWQAGDDRSRARALAEQARDAYRDAGDAHTERRAEVERWLARRRS